jgi:hypothetical protein
MILPQFLFNDPVEYEGYVLPAHTLDYDQIVIVIDKNFWYSKHNILSQILTIYGFKLIFANALEFL